MTFQTDFVSLRKKRFCFCFCLLFFIVLNACFCSNSFAEVKSKDKLHKLAILQGVEKCYRLYGKDEVSGLNPTIEKVMKWTDNQFGETGSSDVWIPTHVGNSLSSGKEGDSNLSCKQVFIGYENKVKGLFGSNGSYDKGDGLYSASGLDSFEKYGYVVSSSGGSSATEGMTKYASIKGKAGKISIDGQVTNISVNDGEIKCEAKISGTAVILDSFKCYSGTINISFVDPNNTRHDITLTYSNKEFKLNNKRVLSGGQAKLDGYGMTSCSQKTLSGALKKSGCISFTHYYDDLGTERNEEIDLFISTVRQEIIKAVQDAVNNHKVNGVSYLGDDKEQFIDITDTEEADIGYYEPIKQKKSGSEKPVKDLSSRLLIKELGIDSSLPHSNYTATNLTNYGSGTLTSTKYNWSNSFVYSLYYYYLFNNSTENGSGGKITLGGGDDGCSETKGSDGYWFRNALEHSDEIPKWCKINETSDYLNNVFSVYNKDSDTDPDMLKKGTFQDVLNWFKQDDNYTDMVQGDFANIKKNSNGYLMFSTAEVEQPETPEDPSATGQTAATCQSSGGAGAVGWIVCPILEWMGSASTHLYTDYVEPKLKINPKLFQVLDNGKNPTRDAWGTFQTIANVVFIILLLVVIFSQLTGVGIDNYGIKRILPKLIIVAILVNLSYLICVICVDLSNILGSSLKGLFDSLGASFDPISVDTGVASTTALGNDSWVPVVLFGILVTYLIVGAVSIVYNPAILLTLLISGLGVVISVLFVFVLFAIREAAIVVLTVVAPIAFVCYTLPNTKKMFDRWLKAWQGLLIVYPICGLLIGGGDYVSRLLLVVESATAGGSSFFQMMTAIVVGIAPVFFIPSLLKGSFAAMGNIGAKVSGFGRSLGGRASSRLQNSNLNKSAQRMGEERRSRIRAGLNKDGELTAGAQRRISRLKRAAGMGGIVGGIAAGRMKAEAANINAAKKNLSASEEASASLTNAMAATGIKSAGGKPIDYYTQQFNEALSRGDKAGMSAALTAAVSSGYMKDKDIAGMVRNAAESGALGEAGSGWMRDTASKFGNGFLATDFEMRHWMQNGGNGNLGGFGEYAKNNINIDDIKPEDLSRLSGDSMAGLAAAGLINQGMAQRVMASNANLSQDKRVMLGAIASGATNARSIQAAGGNSVSDGARMFKEESKALMNTPGAEKVVDGDGGSRDFAAIHTVAGSGGQTTWTDPEGVTHDTATTAQVEKWMGPTATPVSLDASGGVAAGAPSATAVAEASGGVGEGGVFNVRENAGAADVSNYTDETLLNVATDPNVDMNDPLRLAAVAEYERRNPEDAGIATPQEQPQVQPRSDAPGQPDPQPQLNVQPQPESQLQSDSQQFNVRPQPSSGELRERAMANPRFQGNGTNRGASGNVSGENRAPAQPRPQMPTAVRRPTTGGNRGRQIERARRLTNNRPPENN